MTVAVDYDTPLEHPSWHIRRELYSRPYADSRRIPSCERLTCTACGARHHLTTFLHREENVVAFIDQHADCAERFGRAAW